MIMIECIGLGVVKEGLWIVPLTPTTPHAAAGIRIDPPPSVPRATRHSPVNNKVVRPWLIDLS